MGRRAAIALYVTAPVAVMVGLDVPFPSHQFWLRLIVKPRDRRCLRGGVCFLLPEVAQAFLSTDPALGVGVGEADAARPKAEIRGVHRPGFAPVQERAFTCEEERFGVANGARTHDPQIHNLVLCQLSYGHHA